MGYEFAFDCAQSPMQFVETHCNASLLYPFIGEALYRAAFIGKARSLSPFGGGAGGGTLRHYLYFAEWVKRITFVKKYCNDFKKIHISCHAYT